MTETSNPIDTVLRGVCDLVTEQALRDKLALDRPLRVKLGIDPTASDIHLGFAVVLRKLRQFQDLGHQAVLIVGDYTAQLGDPSGKNTTRPMLTEAQVRENAASYIQQMGKILDLERLEVRHNSEWFSKFGFLDTMRLASRLTVARTLERADFAKRMAAEQPIGLHELFYPMMQGYDSVMVEADIELGGADQRFNLLVGRQLQPHFGQPPQVCLMMPLLVGLDGVRKMSKSYGNYIGIDEPPEQQYGKTMSIPDTLMPEWFRLCTDLPEAEIARILAGHPGEAKHRLAREIVTLYHGPEAAERAAEHFRRTVIEKQVPEDVPSHTIESALYDDEGRVPLAAVLADAFGMSRGEARRLIRQGAVRLDEQRITDPQARFVPRSGQLLRAGKRRWVRLVAAQVPGADAG
ncbi:MAG: tyrosine--tRNA ligase [Planctomycetota bacterium]|nr:MAG: tyrosine--tRNA ligase [Planctomycetota bacterium]